nr:ferritin-3, chloroplastic-like [Ipomoea batatas]
MFVKGFSGVSLCKPSGALFPAGLGLGSSVSPVSNLAFPAGRKVGFSISAAVSETADSPLTGVVFQPFQEVKNDAFMVPITPQVSLARQKYSDECEAAINEQINVEYSASYAYHSMFFKESSEEEREHAEKLMKYQVAQRNNDPQMTDFVESEFLEEQEFGTLIRCSSMKMAMGWHEVIGYYVSIRSEVD